MKNELFQSSVISKVESLVNHYLEDMNLELVDIELVLDGGFWYLRIFIENPQGDITVEDCANLSNSIDEEVDNLIEDKFFLEISSPGIERPLKKLKDYIRFTGEDIYVVLKHKIQDNKTFSGLLKEVVGDTEIVLELKNGESLVIPFKEIKKANILYNFDDLN